MTEKDSRNLEDIRIKQQNTLSSMVAKRLRMKSVLDGKNISSDFVNVQTLSTQTVAAEIIMTPEEIKKNFTTGMEEIDVVLCVSKEMSEADAELIFPRVQRTN